MSHSLPRLRTSINRHNRSALSALARGLKPVVATRFDESRFNALRSRVGRRAMNLGLREEDGHAIADWIYSAAKEACKGHNVPNMLVVPSKFNSIVSRVLTHLAARTQDAREVAEIKFAQGESNLDRSREAEIRQVAKAHAAKLGLTAKHAELVMEMLRIARFHQDAHRAALEHGLSSNGPASS